MTKMFYAPQDPRFVREQRAEARRLRATQWWKQKLAQGECYHCQQKFMVEELTMDHLVPIARGGKSSKGNIVVSCKACNSAKQSKTNVEWALETL